MKTSGLFLILLLNTAYAETNFGDVRLDINLASKHFTTTPLIIDDYNEKNPGFGLEIQITDKFYIHGGYLKENSHGNPGRYLGIGRKVFQQKYITAGLEFTMADGYFKNFTYDATDFRWLYEVEAYIAEMKKNRAATEVEKGLCLYSTFIIISDSGPKILYCFKMAALQYQFEFN
jgi:hypothetical protein